MTTTLNALTSIPPGANVTTRNGVVYVVNAAQQVTAANAADARELCASGNFTPANASGTTAQRPSGDTWPGRGYYDTSINQFIVRNGMDSAWLGASGNVV